MAPLSAYHERETVGVSRQVNGRAIRIDRRYALPALAFAALLLAILLIGLCGREGTPDASTAVDVQDQTATPVPTFTPGPSPTPGPPTPTPGPDDLPVPPDAPGSPEERDDIRQLDLAAIQDALEEYRSDEGGYPSTDGNIQTLCAFADTDAGCALLDVLDPIPEDPLGDPVQMGYFYASDGQSYTVFALRESEEFLPCPEHPAHLEGLPGVMCVSGP